MRTSIRKQALTLTIANVYTRALGFALRLITARLMGAEAMGVMELASSGVMLAITPVTAGVPTAMSRLTARPGADHGAVLQAGLSLVKRWSLRLIPALTLLAPAMAWLLGDWRTLPSILTGAPAIWLLGLCAVYSGWCYGRNDALTPAVNECAEQTIRCVLSLALLLIFAGSSIALTAALPGLAEIAAGVAVYCLFRSKAPAARSRPDERIVASLSRLCAPTTAARLCQTALRALNAVLLPVCLRRSGLSASAATARFGMLGGMATPLLMLPGIVTGAICMVAAPAVSRLEANPGRLRRTMRQMLLSGAAVGIFAMAAIFLLADVLGNAVYHQPALAPLLRLMCPCALLMSLQQVQYGMITGLGLQARALKATVASSAVSLVLTALLCPLPQLRLYGAGMAMVASSLLRVIWQQILLHRGVRSRPGAAAHFS